MGFTLLNKAAKCNKNLSHFQTGAGPSGGRRLHPITQEEERWAPGRAHPQGLPAAGGQKCRAQLQGTNGEQGNAEQGDEV